MNVADALAADIAGLRVELGAMREIAVAIGHAVPAMLSKVILIQQHGMAAAAYVSGIENTVGAARMCGELEALTRQEPVNETPLFAGMLTPKKPQEVNPLLALASLHRANDRTLDPDADETF